MRSVAATTIWIAAIALVVPSCADDSIVGTSGVTSVTVPSALELELGETREIAATVAAGPGVPTSVTWVSSNPSIATVVGQTSGSQLAQVTALSLGSTTLRATATADVSKFAETQVTIGPATIATVAIAPATPDVIKGQSLALAVSARTARGVAVLGRPVTWTTSNPGVATVDDQGVVTGVGFGNATIAAAIDGLSGSAAVTVKTGAVAQVAITP